MHDDFQRFGQHLTSDQGPARSHFDPNNHVASVDASQQDEHKEATAMSLAFFSRELLAKTCWWPQVTPDNLYEGNRPKLEPG